MAKEIKLVGAREAAIAGMNTLANAVTSTLGPKGQLVLLPDGSVTKDGVTVAKAVELSDPFENLGARLAKEVASKTADGAGDGTTSATALAQAITNIGLKNIVAGASAVSIKTGISIAAASTIKNLKQLSKPVTTPEEVAQVGTVSANNDTKIGDMLSEAMDKVGMDGVITVDKSRGAETTLDVKVGIQIDRGYLSHMFMTDDLKAVAEYENAKIIVTDLEIVSYNDIYPVLAAAAKEQSPIIIIADDIKGEALEGMIQNKLRSGLKVVAIKAPEFGNVREAVLEDIAIATGAKFISSKAGYQANHIVLEMAGKVGRAVISAKSTTLYNGAGSEESLTARCEVIKAGIEKSTMGYEKENYQRRLARLAGGIAVIHVGASTETELGEKLDRVEDALHATRAAVEEGIVPGGGITLIHAANMALDELMATPITDDVLIGVKTFVDACHAPFSKIVANCGYNPEVVLHKVMTEAEHGAKIDYEIGYNAATDTIQNMYDAGVIDPVKVTRLIVENAVSITNILLNINCIIAETEAAPAFPGYPMM